MSADEKRRLRSYGDDDWPAPSKPERDAQYSCSRREVRTVKRPIVSVVVVSLVAAAVALILTTMAFATGPVVHRVSVGSPDACLALVGDPRPGCDGNFSLTAREYADGSVSGQYTDRFANGDGFHAVVDCLVVDGDRAWISGVITSGRFTDPDTGEVFDLAGLSVITSVQDNGTSANDPVDQISFSFIGFDVPCTEQPDVDLLDVPEGQVTVR